MDDDTDDYMHCGKCGCCGPRSGSFLTINYDSWRLRGICDSCWNEWMDGDYYSFEDFMEGIEKSERDRQLQREWEEEQAKYPPVDPEWNKTAHSINWVKADQEMEAITQRTLKNLGITPMTAADVRAFRRRIGMNIDEINALESWEKSNRY